MLRNALIDSLLQIADILDVTHTLPKEKADMFYRESNTGKHVRHVLDHFLTFLAATQTGLLDYNRRNRESAVETDWTAAKTQLHGIVKSLQDLDCDAIAATPLDVISEIDACQCANEHFTSNIAREMLYLVNHTIHHAAYIALLAKIQHVALPTHIGIAPATATHLRKTG